eukprot:CAMPEP_0172596316 /NCGR_PEP_ID=MMETSP1068-20121228/16085_1 /TAXON_ID=35684 /ORGANISM="Pseudopedinella elastica, Strain CCMP716" /LENGTH=92 /DNA_ID=CAMNT_0013395277 /DNA_START=212 /DNA_END=490 /DNA_ORIENTATION=-
MTISVLAAYRQRKIGRRLLERVLDKVETSEELSEVEEVYLHVQTNNESALKLYHGHGFETRETIKGYYKRIEPPDCYLVAKKIERKNAAAKS